MPRLATLAALCTLACSCAHERVVWPPTRAQVEEIGYAAYDDRYVRVEFVDPIAARRELGDELSLPAEQVRGLTVKYRGRGALIGALVGAVSGGAVLLGDWYLFADRDFVSSACPAACAAKGIATWVVGSTLIGMAVGYMISGRHTYDFVPAP